MWLLRKPKVQNCISEKYGLYRYEYKDSSCNLGASYIQQCSSFITSKLDFDSGKTVSFRRRMNNHIIACLDGTPTNKFDNDVFKYLLVSKNLQKGSPKIIIRPNLISVILRMDVSLTRKTSFIVFLRGT